jgi:hypothetical protein
VRQLQSGQQFVGMTLGFASAGCWRRRNTNLGVFCVEQHVWWVFRGCCIAPILAPGRSIGGAQMVSSAACEEVFFWGGGQEELCHSLRRDKKNNYNLRGTNH